MSNLASMKQAKQVLNLLDGATTDEVQNLIEGGDLVKLMLTSDLSRVNREAFEQLLDGQPDTQQLSSPANPSPEEQVANLVIWDREYNGSHLGATRIEAMLAEAPDFVADPARRLVRLTLCWTLNSLGQSVYAKIVLMKHLYGKDMVFPSDHLLGLKAKGDIYLPDGAPEFVPNHLWWEVIDFGANRQLAPDQVDPAKAAGIQVFDAACQHRDLVLQHNGGDNPYWDVPGLRVKVPGKSRPFAPYVNGYSDGEVSVRLRWAGRASSDFSVPVVLREW